LAQIEGNRQVVSEALQQALGFDAQYYPALVLQVRCMQWQILFMLTSAVEAEIRVRALS
jgi:hypothetical protein